MLKEAKPPDWQWHPLQITTSDSHCGMRATRLIIAIFNLFQKSQMLALLPPNSRPAGKLRARSNYNVVKELSVSYIEKNKIKYFCNKK